MSVAVWVDRSAWEKVRSKDKSRLRIDEIELIIDQLTLAAMEAAISGNLEEFNIDDGQTKEKAIFKDVKSITASINDLMKLQELLLSRINGQQVRLVDGNALPNNRYWR
jgi:hypothetical protein